MPAEVDTRPALPWLPAAAAYLRWGVGETGRKLAGGPVAAELAIRKLFGASTVEEDLRDNSYGLAGEYLRSLHADRAEMAALPSFQQSTAQQIALPAIQSAAGSLTDPTIMVPPVLQSQRLATVPLTDAARAAAVSSTVGQTSGVAAFRDSLVDSESVQAGNIPTGTEVANAAVQGLIEGTVAKAFGVTGLEASLAPRAGQRSFAQAVGGVTGEGFKEGGEEFIATLLQDPAETLLLHGTLPEQEQFGLSLASSFVGGFGGATLSNAPSAIVEQLVGQPPKPAVTIDPNTETVEMPNAIPGLTEAFGGPDAFQMAPWRGPQPAQPVPAGPGGTVIPAEDLAAVEQRTGAAETLPQIDMALSETGLQPVDPVQAAVGVDAGTTTMDVERAQQGRMAAMGDFFDALEQQASAPAAPAPVAPPAVQRQPFTSVADLARPAPRVLSPEQAQALTPPAGTPPIAPSLVEEAIARVPAGDRAEVEQGMADPGFARQPDEQAKANTVDALAMAAKDRRERAARKAAPVPAAPQNTEQPSEDQIYSLTPGELDAMASGITDREEELFKKVFPEIADPYARRRMVNKLTNNGTLDDVMAERGFPQGSPEWQAMFQSEDPKELRSLANEIRNAESSETAEDVAVAVSSRILRVVSGMERRKRGEKLRSEESEAIRVVEAAFSGARKADIPADAILKAIGRRLDELGYSADDFDLFAEFIAPQTEAPTARLGKTVAAQKQLAAAALPATKEATASPLDAKNFAVRMPTKAGAVATTKVNATVREQAGNNHWVAETSDGKFIVVGANRKAVTKARYDKRQIPLVTADPVLGRVPKRGEEHSGKPPKKYDTIEEARAAAREASGRFGETEDVMSEERKAPAGMGEEGTLGPKVVLGEGTEQQEAAPLQVSEIDRLIDTATTNGNQKALEILAEAQSAKEAGDDAKAERLTARAKQAMASQLTKSARVAARKKTAAPAVERTVEAKQALVPSIADIVTKNLLEPLESAKPSEAEVRAIVDAAKTAAEQLPEASIERLWLEHELSDRNTKDLFDSLETDAPLLDAFISGVRARMEKMAAKTNGRAMARLRTDMRWATAYKDGLTPEKRQEILDGYAKALGVELVIPKNGQLSATIRGRSVPIESFGGNGFVYISRPMSLVHGQAMIAHEVMHDIIAKDLDSTQRVALFDAVRDALGNDPALEARIGKRWGKLLSSENMDAALEEALADAGADAALTNRNGFLALLPESVARPIVDGLVKIGSAIRGMLRSLQGLVGVKPSARDQLSYMAEQLTRNRIEAVRKAGKEGAEQSLAQAMLAAQQLRAEQPTDNVPQEPVGADDAVDDRIADPGRDLGDRIANSFLKYFGVSDAIAIISNKVWRDVTRVARDFPIFDAILQSLQDAEAKAHRRQEDAYDRLRFLYDMPAKEAKALASLAYRLRQADIKHKEFHDRFFSQAQGEDWLRGHGASESQVNQLNEVYDVMRGWKAETLGALAKAHGFSHAYDAAEVVQEITREKEAEKPDEAKLRMLESWADVRRQYDSMSRFYVPFTRTPGPRTTIAKDAEGNVTFHTFHERKDEDAVRARAAAFGTVTTLNSREWTDRGDPAPFLAKLTKTMGDAGYSETEIAELTKELMPELVAGTAQAFLLQAKGVPGFVEDLRAALPGYLGKTARAMSRLEFLADSAPARRVLNTSNAERLRGFVDRFLSSRYNRGGLAEKVLRGLRAVTTTQALMAPATGIANLFNAMTIAPGLVAVMTDKPVKAQTEAYVRLGQAVTKIFPQAVADGVKALNAAGASVWGTSEGAIAFAKKHGLIESMARSLPADAAEALRKAARETDVTHDPNLAAFQAWEHGKAVRVLTKFDAGLLYVHTVTEQAARIPTFVALFNAAKTFTDADWARVKEQGYHRAPSAYEFAVWGTRNIAGQFGARNAPEAFRNGVGALAFQFLSWPKNMTHALYQAGETAARDMKSGNLAAMGVLVGMAAIGLLMHGAGDGIPPLAIASKPFQWLGLLDLGFENQRLDAEKGSAEKFFYDTLAGGLPEALKDRPGVVGEAAAVTRSLAARAAPRGLIFDAWSSGRIPVQGTLGRYADATRDLAKAAETKDEVLFTRGFTNLLTPWAWRAAQAQIATTPRGLLGKSAGGEVPRTVIPQREVRPSDVISGMLGAEPPSVAVAREAGMAVAEASEASAAVNLYLLQAVDAMRAGDREGAQSALRKVVSDIGETAKKMQQATGAERQRLMAELSWALSAKDLNKAIENRVKTLWTMRELGVLNPTVGGGKFVQPLRQNILSSGGLDLSTDEDEVEE